MEPIRYTFDLTYTGITHYPERTGTSVVSEDPTYVVDWARQALVNDTARTHATIETHAVCRACNGAGKVPKKRAIYALLPCKPCKGEGQRLLAKREVHRE